MAELHLAWLGMVIVTGRPDPGKAQDAVRTSIRASQLSMAPTRAQFR